MKSNAPSYIRTSILQAISSISYSDAVISLREVTITNETTIESMCTALLSPQYESLRETHHVDGNQLVNSHELTDDVARESDVKTNPSITFLLDASGRQLSTLTQTSNNRHEEIARDTVTVTPFNSRYGVPGVTLIDSSWTRDALIPSNERQWNLLVKTPAQLVTGALVKDLIIEYAIRRVAILYDSSFGEFSLKLSNVCPSSCA